MQIYNNGTCLANQAINRLTQFIIMILYNVTTNIHESVHDQWMIWMRHKHIPEILATGKFSSARMVRVLIEEEMGGVTYSVQYTTDSKETLEKYPFEFELFISYD